MKPGYASAMISLAVFIASAAAWADPPAPAPALSRPGELSDAATKTEPAKEEAPPRNYVNMAVGASTGTSTPIVCAEVSPLSMLAVYACGNGSGFLHSQSAPEIAHFHLSFTPMSWKVNEVWLRPRVSAGFAELQIGADAAGFDFQGTAATNMETAGPEAGLSLQGMMPLYGGFELVGQLSLDLAYFPHAPELATPHAAWAPSATMTLGVGF